MIKRVFFIAIILTLLSGYSASAAKYKCEGVDSIARLGVPNKTRVTIEEGKKDEDTEGKYCAFSVSGVAASSPPLQRVREALKRLSQRNSSSSQHLKILADNVAYALIAASSLKQLPKDLSVYLNANSSNLHNCYKLFQNNKPMSKPLLFKTHNSKFRGFCFYTNLKAYRFKLGNSKHQIIVEHFNNSRGTSFVEQPIPHLVIGVQQNGVRRWFFQPK